MVIGGQTVLLYGEPRLTRDIDITLGVGTEELGKIENVISKLKLKVLVDVETFVKRTMVLPVLDEKSGIRVDFILSFTPYERQAIERAKRVKLGKAIVRFASVEDLIIHKVFAGRARDIEDIKSILLKNKNYDSRYIMKWLKEFDKSLGREYSRQFKKIRK